VKSQQLTIFHHYIQDDLDTLLRDYEWEYENYKHINSTIAKYLKQFINELKELKRKF